MGTSAGKLADSESSEADVLMKRKIPSLWKATFKTTSRRWKLESGSLKQAVWLSVKISWRREKSCGTQHDRSVLLVRTWAIWKKNKKITKFTIYQARTASCMSWSRLASMWSVLSFCYTLLVILWRIVSTHCTAGRVKFQWTWQQRKGDWRQRMSYAVDFLQAETQLFSGGPCHALWCEPEHYVKIIQLLDENVGSMHQWVFPFGRKRLRFRKVCQLLFQEPLSRHMCHHRFCEDWDWPLSQPDTQSLTWFDVRLQASNFQELHHLSIHKCIAASRLVKVCRFLITLIPPLVGLPPKKINESSRALVLDFRFYLFAFLHCIIFLSYFFQICTFDDSTTGSSFVWCHWTPTTNSYYAQTWWVVSEL